MNTLQGLKADSRKQLASLLQDSDGVITSEQAVDTLNLPPEKVASILFNFARHGWLSRVRRGLYIPVSIESKFADIAIEDPWIIANKIYSPSYIGGWSAASYWGFTEQIFTTIIVMTTNSVRNREPTFKDIKFKIKTISENLLFGLKPVWNNQTKSFVSDPSRTIVDLLNQPKLGGGIASTIDIFQQYLNSKYVNTSLLLDYIDRFKNKSIYKRLGFFSESIAPDRIDEIEICRERLSTGFSKLDPDLPSERLITKWRLWIPRGIKND